MSRYVFIAAAALFAGLSLVFAFALAQRDARFNHSLNVDQQPDYAHQIVSPIAVHKAPFDDSDALEMPTVDRSDTGQAQLASYSALEQEPLPTNQPPSRAALSEPPRFDASRIVTRRTNEPSAGPKLLPPASRNSPNTMSPTHSMPQVNPLPTTTGSDLPSVSGLPTTLPSDLSEAAQVPANVPNPFSVSPPTVTFGAPIPVDSGDRSIPSVPSPSPFENPPPSPSPVPTRDPMQAMVPIEEKAPPTVRPMPNAGLSSPLASPHKGSWSLSSGAPGARQFDGSQNPSLEIHKRAPAEVQVGIPATFTAIVRNVGNATAFEVQVMDAVPRGAKLVRTSPPAEAASDGGLVWNLGELAAGQESAISMELIPETEGEIGSVASVKFAAQASVRTISTLPKLSVKQVAPAEVLGGETITFWIEVANVGTGTARDVQLEEDVPAAFRHTSGARSLGLSVGDLAPGESQRYEIEFAAMEAARVSNVVRATAENAATNESSLPIEVRAPKLQLQLVGPRIRYLERPAPFEAVVENVGTAMARDLYIVAYLPRGLHFNSASNEGTYLPEQHAVAWNLAELAAGTKAKTEFTVIPVEEGKAVLRMTSDAEGLRAESTEREVQIEGQSELTFDIDDDHDPIETNGVTTYSIHLTNIGTRPDQDVQLTIEMPEGSTLDQVNAPMKYQAQGRVVAFAALPTLPSKERVTVKVSIRHGREGTQILRASLKSALRSVPVIKDESTQVYVDR